MAKLGQGIRKKLHTRRVQGGGKFHNTSSRSRKIEQLKPLTPEEDASLQSVWETKNVDEFFVNCLKDQDAFMSERSLASIVDYNAKRQRAPEVYDYDDVPIPRRPAWTKSTSRSELEKNEEEAFLNWRRNLARTEQVSAKVSTPYEKNIEVWRQLWRVLERSNLVVQIVDSRNPLLFRSVDLERYVKELGSMKASFLLINKADMLSETQRRLWADHFRRAGVKFAFFSALREQIRVDIQSKAKRDRLGLVPLKHDTEEQEAEINSGSIAMSSTSSRGEQKSNDRTVQNPSAQPSTKRRNAFNVLQEDDEEDELETYPSDSSEEETKSSNEPESTSADVASPSAVVIEHSELVDTQIDDMSRSSVSKDMEEEPSPFSDAHSTTHILSCDELLACFHRVYKEYVESQGVDFSAMRDKLSDGRLIVGMVGYPNVGKSATINAMFGEKKVAVAPTPGKTKHFQTLNLTDDLQLCDCPGLVFPQFMNTRADLVCSGILPIDRLRDWFSPVALVCDRVGGHIAEITAAFPGLVLPQDKIVIDGRTLLQCVATLHGWFGTGRVPNESRASRLVLKTYVAGSLLYCHAPPGLGDGELEAFFNSLAHSRRRLVDEVDETNSETDANGDVVSVSSSGSRTSERLDETILSNDPAPLDDSRKGNSKRKHAKKTRGERKQALREKYQKKALGKRGVHPEPRSSFRSSAVTLGNISKHVGSSTSRRVASLG